MKKKQVNSPRVPVYRDTGFELYDADTTASVFRAETGNQREPEVYIYSRYRNPTVVAAEEELMKLEGCDWALLTQSGMSAIDTALSVFQKGRETRPWLFFTEIYGGTISYIDAVLRKRRGLEIITFSPENGTYDLRSFENLISRTRPEFVYAETISNPLLLVADIDEIIRISKNYGARIIIDNTFATPFLYRPLERGADIVLHSVTKYLAGHGNITAGVICGNDNDLMAAAIEYRKYTGHMLAPDDAYRLTTQVMTFGLRFPKQCENALMLAEIFSNSPAAGSVLFPGHTGHKTHDIAVRLLGGKYFGAMITVDFHGDDEAQKRSARDRFISGVSGKIRLIPTLGDPHTILLPVESVWGAKYHEPGMIRISAGFEDSEELAYTVKAALGKF